MPVPRNSMQLDYSRWQQNLIGVLQVDIVYHSQIEIGDLSLFYWFLFFNININIYIKYCFIYINYYILQLLGPK